LSIPASWRTTIATCLDTNPEKRPQSAAEVGRRLASAPAEAAAPVSSPVGELLAPLGAAAVEPKAAPVAEAKPVVEEPKLSPVAESKAAPTPEPKLAPDAEMKLEPKSLPPQNPNRPPLRSRNPLRQPSLRKRSLSPRGRRPRTPSLRLQPRRKPTRKSAKKAKRPKSTTSPSGKKSSDRPLTADFTPKLYPEESRFPVTGLAAAAVIILVIAIIYHFAMSGTSTSKSGAREALPVNDACGRELDVTGASDACRCERFTQTADAPAGRRRDAEPFRQGDRGSSCGAG